MTLKTFETMPLPEINQLSAPSKLNYVQFVCFGWTENWKKPDAPANLFTYVTMKEIVSPALEIGGIFCNCGSLPPNAGDLTCMPIGVVAVVEDRHCE